KMAWPELTSACFGSGCWLQAAKNSTRKGKQIDRFIGRNTGGMSVDNITQCVTRNVFHHNVSLVLIDLADIV
nr:hypothetical protein [Anaerolineae bacterium]